MIFVLNWISIPIWASSLNTIHLYHTVYSTGSPGKEFSPMQEIQQTWVWSLNREDSPGRGNGNLLQYSFLENSMDRRVWWTAVHRVTKIGHDWAHIQACLLYISALIPNRYFKISVSNWTLDLMPNLISLTSLFITIKENSVFLGAYEKGKSCGNNYWLMYFFPFKPTPNSVAFNYKPC